LAQVRAENAWLDGVLLALDEHERPSKELLAARLESGGEGVLFQVFDLLHFEDYDLRPLPTIERKAALRGLLPPPAHVLFTDHVLGRGEDLVEVVRAAGLPGVIAKRADAPYVSGRSPEWRSIAVSAVSAAAAEPVRRALKKTARTRAPSRFEISNPD